MKRALFALPLDIVRKRTVRSPIAAAAFFFTVIAIGTPLLGQTVRVNIPGTAFSADGLGREKVAVQDVGGGVRRFHGPSYSRVTLKAVLPMPPSSAAEPRMQRLVIHFRTNAYGATLRSVEVRTRSNGVLHFDTQLQGDFSAAEVIKPATVANAWDWGRAPIAVSSQSVLRLEVSFPGGLDTGVDPKEFFFLTAVAVDFPRKAIAPSDTTRLEGNSAHKVQSVPSSPAGVIYAVTPNGDLLWYRHDGHEDGTFRWALPQGAKVGTGWHVKQVFCGGDGVIYTVMPNGDLLWNRHEGRGDGSFRWAAPNGKKVGTGWNFEHVFSGGDGVIYAITADGDLLWYRHDGRQNGSAEWAAPAGKKVGTGWNFKEVFSGGDGVIYAVTSDNHLLWYRHDGHSDGSFRWAASQGKTVGNGWDVRQAFSGGDGVIYAVMSNGDLLWNRHDGRGDGSFRWTAPSGKKVGSGWIFPHVF